jgi:hypothetical protein
VVLFQFAFQLFNEPGDKRSLLTEGGNDMWIGHPHMVEWRLPVLNADVVPSAREYRETARFEYLTVLEQRGVDRLVRRVEIGAEMPLSLVGGVVPDLLQTMPIVITSVDMLGCQGSSMLSKTPVCGMC